MPTEHPLDDDDTGEGVAPTTRLQEFYIPVHGYVRLEKAEVAIVNHPTFQRLRKCRQLGFSHLVFPGATHTRFEHSLGALYVAEKIVRYANFNAVSSRPSPHDTHKICKISSEARAIIRLGALLHDIGHIPLGHTLEDELEHLEKHDGEARVDRIADRKYAEHIVDPSLQLGDSQRRGWTLRELIDSLYKDTIDAIFKNATDRLTAYEVLKLVTLKAPSDKTAEQAWKARETTLGKVFPLHVCRDIIGNTICADFLDYLFRDLHHIGKPLTEDRRLYQYMEVRAPTGNSAEPLAQQFVINVGPDQKLRHDALTSIFELLESRYKLAETVLFHRTKLAMTALLDRCFLELRYLYEQADLCGNFDQPHKHLSEQALTLLLEASDDDIPRVIRQLAEGTTDEDKRKLDLLKTQSGPAIGEAVASRDTQQRALELVKSRPTYFDVKGQQSLIELLVTRLEERTMYTLAHKLAFRDLHRSDYKRKDPLPPTLPERLEKIADPAHRRKEIAMMEAFFELSPGSITLYAPRTTKMNAKVANVKLLIDGGIVPFAEYEISMGDASLSGGLLLAQVKRFFELWGISVFVHRPDWHRFEEQDQTEISRTISDLVYLQAQDRRRPSQRRRELEHVLQEVRRKKAARAHLGDETTTSEYSTETFASGIPFSVSKPSNSASKTSKKRTEISRTG